jgi:predicted RNase H-like HicB family nuclease
MLYPIAIEKGDETTAFGVVIPDLPGCFSAGDSFEQALTNAREAIEFHLEALADVGELPPVATPIDAHFSKPEFDQWVWALSDIDVEPYMGKASKINVTLPNLLTRRIDDVVKSNEQYKSRSHFLQLAASREIENMI